jgi:putative acetyltransferase
MPVVLKQEDVEFVVSTGLLVELDADLLSRYPGEPVNGIDAAQFREAGGCFVVARVDAALAGCGAFRPYGPATVELKRMYVRSAFRGQGIGRLLVAALETEAKRRGYAECILETAVRMPEALALYRRCGYVVTPPFAEYVGSERSVCMQRTL